MEIRISVRNLVEFILRSGSIDNRKRQRLTMQWQRADGYTV